ncbi:hypothetical protein J4558_16505 [Leptolyngbya sp. 15MV]|nr:hypothetical protein J4558_16505 [Leptolyngbya sp. 15MV]
MNKQDLIGVVADAGDLSKAKAGDVLDAVFEAIVAPEISRSMEGGILTLQTADAAAIQPVIDAARAARLTIRAVRPWKPSLEDLFMQAVSAPGSGGVGAKEERR